MGEVIPSVVPEDRWKKDLNHDDLTRYSRQLILSEIGIEGQQKIKGAKVLIVGTGGLGAPDVWYIAINNFLRECVGICWYTLKGWI